MQEDRFNERRETTAVRNPHTATREQPPLATAGAGPHAAAKTQRSRKTSILKLVLCPVHYILYHQQENAVAILTIINQHLFMNQIICLHDFINFILVTKILVPSQYLNHICLVEIWVISFCHIVF